jgi:3',5'-cyclic AMP phosphodiesterase CpdA/cellulose biosynthesis protein BcsQ
MGEIVTFYSYKGGIGRTMALANVGVLLCQYGYKVLAVDWDLEAPGLEFFFEDYYLSDLDLETIIQREGIIDLLYSVLDGKLETSKSPQIDNMLIEVPLPNSQEPLHFLTAGRRDQDYFTKVRDLDLETFYAEKKGGYFIEALRNDWKQKYDYVLIDSSTGVTDLGGVCTIQLPDILVLLLTTTEQSLKGTIDIFQRTALGRRKLPFDRLSLIAIPILSKFDSTEEFKIGQEWLGRFSNELVEIYADWLPASVERRACLEVTKIPYMPYFSFGEKLPVLVQGTIDPSGLGYAYESLAALIANKFESVERLLESRSEFMKSAIKTAAESITQPAITIPRSKENPFIAGGPVPPERFIGREREINAVLDSLASPAHGSAAVSGEARIGKTSLLHYISSPEIAEKWGLSPKKCTFILVDSQSIVPFSPMGFWRYVLKSLAARRVHDPGYINGLLKRDDIGDFELGELFDRIARDDKLVVLLLDEFEHIVERVNPDNPQFLYQLRALINRPARGLALVLASRKSLTELCQNMRFVGSPFTTSFMLLSLGPFSSEEANKLIDLYTQGTGITFSDRDRERAYYEISKGHPYQLQEICFELFQRHKERVKAIQKPVQPDERVKKPVILHLSDLQFGPHHAFEDDQEALDKLKEDIDRYKHEGIPRPNIVVVSGDLADTGGDKGDEYGAVTRFLEDLCRHLGIDKRHVVLVPGNHDVNWYKAECIEAQLMLECVRNRRREPFDPHSDVRYLQRFCKYAQFFDDFYIGSDTVYTCDISYVMGFNIIYDFKDRWGIFFLALNSCETEDHHKENHYGYISQPVLVSALKKMEGMIPQTCVKVAVFHHNALAEEREDRLRNFRSEILPPLSQAGFSLVLHGHTHKPNVGNADSKFTGDAQVWVVGAGSASVARAQRPGSDRVGQVPNQYWVLAFELGEDRRQFTAYARHYHPILPGKFTPGKWISYPIFMVAGKDSDCKTFEIGTT